MMSVLVVVLVSVLSLFVTVNSSKCPSSPVFMHAGCDMTITFSNSCNDVKTEILSRVNGQYNMWHDPHNNGTYTLTSGTINSATLELSRLTGDKKYTDKMIFTFETVSNGCKVGACSQSQVTSLLDYSTNYCNLHDLYCSDDGCHPFKKLSYSESIGKCTQHDATACTVV